MPVEDQVSVIYAASNGYLDRIDADRVEEFNEGLIERLHSAAGDTLGKIREGDWSDETQKALADALKECASDFGYDLDEEGMPLDEEVPVSKRDNGGARTDDRSDDDGEGDSRDGDGDGDGNQSDAEAAIAAGARS